MVTCEAASRQNVVLYTFVSSMSVVVSFHACCCFISCQLMFHFMSVDVSLHVCCCFYSMLAVVECLLILEGEHDRMSSLPRRSLPFHLLSLCFQLVLLSSFQISLPPFSCLSRTLHRFYIQFVQIRNLVTSRFSRYYLPSLIAAWAAARRAMGTRNGLQDT